MIRTFVVSAFVMAAVAIGAAPVAAGGVLNTTDIGIDTVATSEVALSELATGIKFDVSEHPLSPVSQQQAVRSAQQYLDVMGFSRSGLINQLTSFDGYTPAQAAYGVATTGL